MKIKIIFLAAFLTFASNQIIAQTSPNNTANIYANQPQTDDKLEKINESVTKLTKTVKDFTNDLKSFFEKFTSNQGLRLTEKQQLILLAFEVLNRAEQRISTLQKQKIEMSERLSSVRLSLARIKDDLLPDSIDRYVSTRGTTNAEQLREIRRQALTKEQTELTKLVFEVENTLEKNDEEIRQTEIFIRDIRARIFPQIQKELSDL
ncbi:MAG TPA: hypothetical protein PKY59_23355 [Pyrinomonadaceae bacterium]|nr:hypothetical protein [Pyrinomonadaceae bacterium]